MVLFSWYKNMLVLEVTENRFLSKMSNLIEMTYTEKLATSTINPYSKQALVDPCEGSAKE